MVGGLTSRPEKLLLNIEELVFYHCCQMNFHPFAVRESEANVYNL